jgi:hypothetical protein
MEQVRTTSGVVGWVKRCASLDVRTSCRRHSKAAFLTFEEKGIGATGISGNTPQEDEDIAKVSAASAAATMKGGG